MTPPEENPFSRTRLLLGDRALSTLGAARVAVFGVGGVGGYAVEVLARSGVGRLDLFDADLFAPSNLNRQLHALHSTLGRAKVDVAAERIHDINPQCDVRPRRLFYLPARAGEVPMDGYDYVLDCIDTVTAKVELVRRCHAAGVPLISSMGAANKLDPTAFRVADITKTKMDPLAKVVRRKLRELRIPHLKVVYSEEPPLPPAARPADHELRDGDPARVVPASCAFVPAAAGLVMGGEVVKDLLRRAGTLRRTGD